MTVHIVYLDDDEDMRDLLGYALRKRGFTVAPAADPDQAWSELSEGSILLTDLHLEHGDTTAFCERVRRAYPEMCIVGVTGDKTSTERMISAGASQVLIKPVTVDAVIAAIDVS